ncbi:MAG: tetratricopeptide repeat protein [Thermoanaerobaculia bacterium]
MFAAARMSPWGEVLSPAVEVALAAWVCPPISAVARDELRRLLAAYPVDFAAHLAYARLLRADGRGEEALERLERALRLAPGACEAHLEQVTLLAELGRPEEAAAALDQMRERCRQREMLEQAAAVLDGEARRRASVENHP